MEYDRIAQSMQKESAASRSFNVTLKGRARRRGTWSYVKGGDDVAQLLSVMGAHSAVLTLESVRVLRGVPGDVNRVVNCETAKSKGSE